MYIDAKNRTKLRQITPLFVSLSTMKLKALRLPTLTIISFLFWLAAGLAQMPDTSLQKYSYHIIGFVGENPGIGGTAFFVKYKSKFYLVSAWHCFSFQDSYTQAYDNPKGKEITTVIVYRAVSEIPSGKFTFISLMDSIDHRPIYSEIRQSDTILDISAIQVERKPPFLFDYIELNDHGMTPEKAGDSLTYFGFPVINGTQVDISQGFTGAIKETFTKQKEFNIISNAYTGCSGSPLFTAGQWHPRLKGVLFYAFKDISGMAHECRAIDISWLFPLLKRTPDFKHCNFHQTYLSLKLQK